MGWNRRARLPRPGHPHPEPWVLIIRTRSRLWQTLFGLGLLLITSLSPGIGQAAPGLSISLAGQDFPTVGIGESGLTTSLPSLDFRGDWLLVRFHLLDSLRRVDRIEHDWYVGIDLFLNASFDQWSEEITFAIQPGLMAMGGRGWEDWGGVMAAVRLGSEYEAKYGGVGLYVVPGLGLGKWDDEAKVMSCGSLQFSTWFKRHARERTKVKYIN